MKKLKIKKISYLVFAFTFLTASLFFAACKEENYLINYVNETRTDIYRGENEKYPLKAYYGKKDGKNQLTLFLNKNETDENSVFAELPSNGEKIRKEFTFDPVKNALCAIFPTDNFTEKEFTVSIFCGSEKVDVILKSIVPENSLSLNDVLSVLSKNQKTLINNYFKDGVMNGKICARILVKDDYPYWYIGITDENGKLTAFLTDGIDGSVKAVREIF